jgi:hypothetical protein
VLCGFSLRHNGANALWLCFSFQYWPRSSAGKYDDLHYGWFDAPAQVNRSAAFNAGAQFFMIEYAIFPSLFRSLPGHASNSLRLTSSPARDKTSTSFSSDTVGAISTYPLLPSMVIISSTFTSSVSTLKFLIEQCCISL